jgi:hypothetical protein
VCGIHEHKLTRDEFSKYFEICVIYTAHAVISVPTYHLQFGIVLHFSQIVPRKCVIFIVSITS